MFNKLVLLQKEIVMHRNHFFYSTLLFVLVIFISCSNGSQQGKEENLSTDLVINNNNPDNPGDSSKGPRFTFTEEEHDFGKVIQGEKVSYAFKFKNSGKSDLLITDARGSCGCMIADYPKKPIAPGEESEIDVKFSTEGKKGFQSKTITLIANTQPNTKVLKIKAQVQVPEEE